MAANHQTTPTNLRWVRLYDSVVDSVCLSGVVSEGWYGRNERRMDQSTERTHSTSNDSTRPTVCRWATSTNSHGPMDGSRGISTRMMGMTFIDWLGMTFLVMAALRSRCGHYIFALWYLSIFFFYSSPNLSGRRLDAYHTSTHGVALVRI